ncbi:cytochrome c peroxidase [Tateyamaria armeniaca]|uniref:Cytochrome c peroxidase n=1 Tax=Tateyamaria armeniaca TaxID=2518930 RepID=A0ABW8USY8_9RHOB
MILLSATPAFATDLPQPLGADDFITVDAAQAKLGQLLFYDRILSGNRNIACSTCHHPDLGTGDGLSLGIGEGVLALARTAPPAPVTTASASASRAMRRVCGTSARGT